MVSKLLAYAPIGILILVAISSSGCGDKVAEETLDAAKKSVQSAFEDWKQGVPATTPQASSPSIEFRDDDRDRGARLVEFQVSNAYMDTDGTARCAVEFVIQYGDQAEERRQVTYQVVTKDNKTIIGKDPMS